MGSASKSVAVIDAAVQESIEKICQAPSGCAGIVMGQISEEGKFLVCHLIRASSSSLSEKQENEDEKFDLVATGMDMPENKENRDVGYADDGGPGDSESRWKLKLTKNIIPCQDLKDLSIVKLPQLAVQVGRLLPGGLSVLGFFFTYPEPVPKPNRQRLKDILHEMHTLLKKDCGPLFRDVTRHDMLILTFSPATKQINTSIYLDAMDAKSIIKPLTIQHATLSWIELRLNCQVNLDRPVSLKSDVVRLLKDTVEQFQNIVDDSIYLIGGKFLDQEPINQPKQQDGLDVTMLQSYPSSGGDTPIKSADGRLVFTCNIASRAYVVAGTPASTAIKKIKDDLIRSMTTRSELHCEDFLITDADEKEFDVVHELPRRILAKLPHSIPTLSSYLSEGEAVRDSLDVFVGLLDLPESLHTGQLLSDIEHSPHQDAIDSALESVSTHSGEIEPDFSDDRSGSPSSARGSLVPKPDSEKKGFEQTAAILAACFAVLFGLYQFYLFNSKSDTNDKSEQ